MNKIVCCNSKTRKCPEAYVKNGKVFLEEKGNKIAMTKGGLKKLCNFVFKNSL